MNSDQTDQRRTQLVKETSTSSFRCTSAHDKP